MSSVEWDFRPLPQHCYALPEVAIPTTDGPHDPLPGHEPGLPEEDAECLVCMEDIYAEPTDGEDANYAEYMTHPDHGSQWLPAKFCEGCILRLVSSQFKIYSDAVKSPSCAAEHRRLLRRGPPRNVRDDTGLPCPEGREAVLLWFSSSSVYRTARLQGAPVGEERTALIDALAKDAAGLLDRLPASHEEAE